MTILDTDVVSELMKPSFDPVVRGWVHARRGNKLYTTSITLAEIRYGIECLPAGRLLVGSDRFGGVLVEVEPGGVRDIAGAGFR